MRVGRLKTSESRRIPAHERVLSHYPVVVQTLSLGPASLAGFLNLSLRGRLQGTATVSIGDLHLDVPISYEGRLL